MSRYRTIFCLWGVVIKHPLKSSSFQMVPSTNSSTVFRLAQYVWGSLTVVKTP